MEPRVHNYGSSFWTTRNCQPDTELIGGTVKVLCLQCVHFKVANRKVKNWQKYRCRGGNVFSGSTRCFSCHGRQLQQQGQISKTCTTRSIL